MVRFSLLTANSVRRWSTPPLKSQCIDGVRIWSGRIPDRVDILFTGIQSPEGQTLAPRPAALEKVGTSRAAFAATIGNMLEFYDFITYSFFATEIGHAFFPTQSEYGSLMLSLATFGAGFVTRPIGGIVLGIFSDRVGRRPAMLLSFALMGLAILTLALTPSYSVIGLAAPIIVIVARMAQGFALGGEVGPTTAYLMEIAPPERRALVVSWQPASQQ